MNNKKKTAVEWLIEKIEEQREGVETDLKTILYHCYVAKQMEKEQMRVRILSEESIKSLRGERIHNAHFLSIN